MRAVSVVEPTHPRYEQQYLTGGSSISQPCVLLKARSSRSSKAREGIGDVSRTMKIGRSTKCISAAMKTPHNGNTSLTRVSGTNDY